MTECAILSIDKATACIEAAFLVKGSWIINRIHHPMDTGRRLLDLGDEEKINAYIEQYAKDNYGLVASPVPADGRLFVEDQAVHVELKELGELVTQQAVALTGVIAKLEEQTETTSVLAKSLVNELANLHQVLLDKVTEIEEAAELRDEATELVFEKFRSQFRALERPWWEKLRAWILSTWRRV